jgi:hypothetical protein
MIPQRGKLASRNRRRTVLLTGTTLLATESTPNSSEPGKWQSVPPYYESCLTHGIEPHNWWTLAEVKAHRERPPRRDHHNPDRRPADPYQPPKKPTRRPRYEARRQRPPSGPPPAVLYARAVHSALFLLYKSPRGQSALPVALEALGHDKGRVKLVLLKLLQADYIETNDVHQFQLTNRGWGTMPGRVSLELFGDTGEGPVTA